MADLHHEFDNTLRHHQARIDRRAADTLPGLAAGLVADGTINLKEAQFLENWIASNLAHLDDPVINLLYRRLSDMLADGVLDAEESQELLGLLGHFAGPTPSAPQPSAALYTPSNGLPLNQPAPDLVWAGSKFLFTGIMAYGPRKDCEALVIERGGIIAPTVSKKVDYLVVGTVGNDQWRHSSYGTKIIKAVDLRESGASIAIISERHWQTTIFG